LRTPPCLVAISGAQREANNSWHGSIHGTQLIGAPLYWINRDLYYAYMSLTKQSFGLLITTMTQWWGPTTIRISGDASVAGQIRKTKDGLVEFSFPERMIMIANHQVRTRNTVAGGRFFGLG
jgi:hypothetical protein